jgi:hypothetical protein
VFAVQSDADLTAFGSQSGAIAARGAPIAGARVTLVGALSVRLGTASPPGVGVTPGSTFSALQLEAFTSGEAVTLDQLTLRVEGTADDSTAIAMARLYRDLDEDGAVGDGDSIEANAVADGDDGLISFVGLGLPIGADASAFYLIELELAADATAGGTLRLVLESNDHVRATGAATGAIEAVGAPISGSAFTIVMKGGGTGPAGQDEGCGCNAMEDRSVGVQSTAWIGVLLVGLILRRGRRRRA